MAHSKPQCLAFYEDLNLKKAGEQFLKERINKKHSGLTPFYTDLYNALQLLSTT